MKNTGLALLYCFVEGAAVGSLFRAPQENDHELPPVQARSERREPASRRLFHQASIEVLNHHPLVIMERFGVGKAFPNWQSVPAFAKCDPDVAIFCIRKNAVLWLDLPSCVQYDAKVLAFAIQRAAEPDGRMFNKPVTGQREARRLVPQTIRALREAWQRGTTDVVPFSVKQDPAVLRAAIEMNFLSNFEDLLAVFSEDDFYRNDYFSSSASDPPSRATENESERRAERLHRNRPKLDRFFEQNPDIFEMALANKLINNYGHQAPEKFRNDASVVINWIERKQVGALGSKAVFGTLPLSLRTNPAVVIAAMGPYNRELRQNESQKRLIESFREVDASLRGNADVVKHALRVQKFTRRGQMMGLDSRAAWDILVSEPAKSDAGVLLAAMGRRMDGRGDEEELIVNWEEHVPRELRGHAPLVNWWIHFYLQTGAVTNEWWRTQVLEPAKSDKKVVAKVLPLRRVIKNWAQDVPEALQQDPEMLELVSKHRPDLLVHSADG